jgi:DNA-binding transcriptional MocR family regulator
MTNKLNWLNNIARNDIRFNLGAGVPPLDSYPYFNPGKLFEGESLKPSDESINYHPTAGFIKNTAAKVLKANEGIDFKTDNIVITNGVQEAIALALACFRKKMIACLDPSYPGLEDAATTFGCNLIKIPLENWLTQLETLPLGSLFYLSADFSNPTGTSLSIDERIQLTSIAARNKFYIFDDATYRPFNLDPALPTLFSLNSEFVIHAISFSKILSPGLRTAFVYLPEALKKAFVGHKSNLSLNNSGITQTIVENWLQENNFQLSVHLGKAKERLSKNRKVLEKYDIAYNGGFFCTLNIAQKADFDFCEALLKKEQIAVIPMCLFSDNPKFEKQLRLCLSNIEEDALDPVLTLIKNFVP